MLSGIESFIRTLFGVTLIVPGIIVLSALALLLGLAGASPSTLQRFVYAPFARLCMWVAGTRVVVHAGETLSAGSAYVVVSNHRSNWDVPVLVAGLPELISRFVVKEELMKIPVFGVALQKTGNLVVVRSRGANDARSIRDGMSGRPSEVSMLFFAEGRRYDDDEIHPFKVGAFATAIGAGLPILPVAIAGSDRVLPNGRVLLRRRPVVVEIGEAIDVSDCDHEDRQSLREETRDAVIALYERARTRLAELD